MLDFHPCPFPHQLEKLRVRGCLQEPSCADRQLITSNLISSSDLFENLMSIADFLPWGKNAHMFIHAQFASSFRGFPGTRLRTPPVNRKNICSETMALPTSLCIQMTCSPVICSAVFSCASTHMEGFPSLYAFCILWKYFTWRAFLNIFKSFYLRSFSPLII